MALDLSLRASPTPRRARSATRHRRDIRHRRKDPPAQKVSAAAPFPIRTLPRTGDRFAEQGPAESGDEGVRRGHSYIARAREPPALHCPRRSTWGRGVRGGPDADATSRTRTTAELPRGDARWLQNDPATSPTTAGPVSASGRRAELAELRPRRAGGATAGDSRYPVPFSTILRVQAATAVLAEVDLHLADGFAYPSSDRLFGAPVALSDLGG